MRTFEQDVFPYIGHSPIAEIKPLELLEVLEVLRRIENAWGIGEDSQGTPALRRGVSLRNNYR